LERKEGRRDCRDSTEEEYRLLLPPYIGWEERIRAEEAFNRLLEEVRVAKRQRRLRKK
jgi:hypothetical protein